MKLNMGKVAFSFHPFDRPENLNLIVQCRNVVDFLLFLKKTQKLETGF